MSSGRLFPSVGPAAVNAQSPTVRWWVHERRAAAKMQTADIAVTGYPPNDVGRRISTVGQYHAVTETPSSLACTGCTQRNAASEDWPVMAQLTDYLKSVDLLPRLQSGFRPHHSETTTLALVFHLPLSTTNVKSWARSRQPFTLAAGPWHLHWCRLEYAYPSPAAQMSKGITIIVY